MALLVFTAPHDTDIPEAHYTPCDNCEFPIKFYYAGKKQDITKEIECPICHYKNKIRI